MPRREADVRRHLLERLEPNLDELIARIVTRVQAFEDHDAGYGAVPAPELAIAADGLVRTIMRVLAEERPPSEDELELATLLGERRARQGVPLENVLRGIRVGAREALNAVQGLAAESGLDATATVDLAIDLWDAIDAVSEVLTEAHHRVELARVRRDQQQRGSFVHALVRGTLDASEVHERATSFGLDADAVHVIVRARPTAEHSTEEIERVLLPSPWSVGLVAVVEEDVVGVLPGPPAQELPVAAGIGAAVALTALPRSFRDATRALDTAIAFGRTGCRGLADDVLRAVILAEDELGALLTARYVEPVRALGAFGEELLRSVLAYLNADQNVETAAGELFVHPNTLRHRLSRFEETTGASLRNCEQLTEVWWALTRDRAAHALAHAPATATG